MFSQGVEIKKPRAVSERIEPGMSRRQLFLRAFYGERQAPPDCLRTGRDVGWSL